MRHMLDLVAKFRLFYAPTREPLRRRVHTTLLAIAALAVTAGLIAGSTVAALIGPLALLLAVPAVEKVRAQVTPAASPPGKHAAPEVTDDSR
ncbi:hypothetical protein JOF56_003728 [Kibdelosporangium banguiense]|uniref:DUF3040 domain-containing protein n=1 Tax=Kibdelosporangium banguiense TaxID=1365924 RepID=A0ABS4TFZ0_9PSEU|nr:hypothetical protein [Kibdelosporangium banguiense]MBP2323343.1 hypothetical protein [Kibdelosporangium banguiense]